MRRCVPHWVVGVPGQIGGSLVVVGPHDFAVQFDSKCFEVG